MRTTPKKPKGGMLVSNKNSDICCLMEDGGVGPRRGIDHLKRQAKTKERRAVQRQIDEERYDVKPRQP